MRYARVCFCLNHFLWLGVLACQPVRPLNELAPTPGAIAESGVISETTSLSDTHPSTQVAVVPSTPRDMKDCPPIQEQAIDLIVHPAWQVGDLRHYQISRLHQDVVDGALTPSLSMSTPLTITILEANDDGYVLEWVYGATTFDQESAPPPDRLTTMLIAPNYLRLEYEVDANGDYRGLLNGDEVFDTFSGVMQEMFILLARGKITHEAIESSQIILDQMAADTAAFDTLVTSDVQLFHEIYGFHFTSAEPIEVDDQRSIIVGDPPLPAHVLIYPTHYGPMSGCLSAWWFRHVDPDEARDGMLAAMEEQAKREGFLPPSKDDLPSQIKAQDSVIFTLDTRTGWIRSMTSTHSFRLEDIGFEELSRMAEDTAR